ncbi:ABC transporter ATP-binding protein [Dialister micraerophilus]|uniref:Cyclic beta-1,2-glucan ABC superfamily ATP binding cassette transporter, ABC/membrane protein n=3 Tax=Dialister micraerophilus TaxID=309120 RepID=F2BY21_9FIRM|nr:ABC transporter ATP-binding protein [Dialister micraerophilus]EGF12582.1 cyclic beta-1,2-glucan ABC superfamily ATP binding cassette transporter, ABC/membrane protein [Dialister micraerophilus DSM 19965]
MIKFYEQRFALTKKGAKGLTKATMLSLIVYFIQMLPVILLMKLCDDILKGILSDAGLYSILSIIILVILYPALLKEYDLLYNATYKASANLRIDTAERMRKLPLWYFSRHNISDMTQMIMSDITGIEHAMSHSIPKVFGFIGFFICISVLMFFENLKMSIAVITPILCSFAFILLSRKMQIKIHNKYFKQLRENSEAFQETIEMQQEIKSYCLSKYINKKLNKKMDLSEKMHLIGEIKQSVIMIFSILTGYLGVGIVIITGTYLLMTEQITLVYMIGYFLASLKFKEIVDSSEENIMEILYLTPKIERIREMKNVETEEGKDFEFSNFDIELEDVEFSYEKGIKVLNGVSFKARQGEVTAIVGKSGCGKSSILKLISKLYDYDKGKIIIGGKNIKNISTDSLFKNISMVFQDVVLFNTTVYGNILIGRKDATREEVYEAAKLAGCDTFIKKLSDQYETVVGENGATLSGGERQRISIARAFLKNSPILILDEFMTNLDIETEKEIQLSLNELIKNKTVIVISHRMKSIEKVNHIVVINNGVVECEGTHEELIEKSFVYNELLNKSKMIEDFIY